MPDILIATLGEAAPAISFAFERWHEYRPAAELAIIHTDPIGSQISLALARLRKYFSTEYPNVPFHAHEIYRYINGSPQPMNDVDDDGAAWDYFRGVFGVLRDYRDSGYRLHLLVSGGRKSMAFYASTAAAAVFRETGDQLWTVHSSKDLMKENVMQIPAGRKSEVQLVNLPILPARLSDDELARLSSDPQSYFAGRMENRMRFMNSLTPAERQLAELIQANPYLETQALAQRLNKNIKTIENQLHSLYTKMVEFTPLESLTENSQKRLLLADLLRGHLD